MSMKKKDFSVGDFGTPEYINWSKWKRKGWWAGGGGAVIGLLYLLYLTVKNLVVPNWPW